MPFEKLMEHVAAISPEEADLPLRVFAERWREPAERIMDAITAVRVVNGERTYITVHQPDAAELTSRLLTNRPEMLFSDWKVATRHNRRHRPGKPSSRFPP